MAAGETVDILRTKRLMQNIAIELQQFMQKNIYYRLGQMLNYVLEAYKVPTSSLSPIKDRFFNNFIRTTEFHAVNEFIEKIIIFLNRELATKNAENSLYGKYRVAEMPPVNGNYDAFIATTWHPPLIRCGLFSVARVTASLTCIISESIFHPRSFSGCRSAANFQRQCRSRRFPGRHQKIRAAA